MGSLVTCRHRLLVSRHRTAVGLHTPVPGVSSRAVMPPDNTAHISQKGYSKGTRAGHVSSQNEDTARTGAVLPTHQPDARPDAIGELWFQVFHPVNKRPEAREVWTLLIPISEITVNPGRREAQPADVKELADNILELGLLSPITVDKEYTLIAGLHRLEAAKLLGWTEIECTVSGLEGLQAKLAEIDENFVRKDLSDAEFRELLLRRKEIYETLHPETKAGAAQAAGMNRAIGNNVSAPGASTLKSFTSDTAEKLGVSKRVIEENLQIAQNLIPEAKQIVQDTSEKIKKKDLLKLSRLPPERQTEAASQLSAGNIHSMDEYQPPLVEPKPAGSGGPAEPQPPIVPYSSSGRHFATIEESIADLKNPDKDCSYTPDSLLAELDYFIQKFHREFEWYSDPFCTVVFPDITQVQFDYLKQRLDTISTALHDLLKQMKRSMKK